MFVRGHLFLKLHHVLLFSWVDNSWVWTALLLSKIQQLQESWFIHGPSSMTPPYLIMGYIFSDLSKWWEMGFLNILIIFKMGPTLELRVGHFIFIGKIWRMIKRTVFGWICFILTDGKLDLQLGQTVLEL